MNTNCGSDGINFFVSMLSVRVRLRNFSWGTRTFS